MRRSSAEGFSLLEVLIALFILSVGAASVLSLFAAAASTHKRSIDRTQAALLAERLFSEVQVRYGPGDRADELRKEVEEEVPAEHGSYTWDVWMYHPARGSGRGLSRSSRGGASPAWHEDELYVRVIIYWKQKAEARSETFHAILLPGNEGGTSHEAAGSRRRRSLR